MTKRRRQAEGVRKIVDDLITGGETNIIVIGDLNEGPTVEGQTATNLAALYDQNGPLVDVYSLPAFAVGKRPGSFESCTIPQPLRLHIRLPGVSRSG
jgi:hypothetical protein